MKFSTHYNHKIFLILCALFFQQASATKHVAEISAATCTWSDYDTAYVNANTNDTVYIVNVQDFNPNYQFYIDTAYQFDISGPEVGDTVYIYIANSPATFRFQLYHQTSCFGYVVSVNLEDISVGEVRFKSLHLERTVEGNWIVSLDRPFVITVCDALGKMVYQTSNFSKQVFIETAHLPSSVYFCNLRDESGHTKTIRLY